MEERRKKTIAITSGKGGVGKSAIVSNMAYLLSVMKKQTYILDADLALGNIDIMLGVVPRFNIRDLINGEKSMQDIIVDGPFGIKVIPATSGIAEFSNLSVEEKTILLSSFQDIPDYDFLIMDTSAGISSNVLYFNAISHDVFVIVTPDPASLTDSYATIKVLHKSTMRRDFRILVNMVRDEREALDVYRKLLLVTDRFLDVSLDFGGYIPSDKNVNLAIKKQRLWAESFPETFATKALQQICDRLVY
ncbi:MAG TPA: flagellar synthesis regulator FleN [Deltaproteobacteria bacterium]|nr:flagellar synthesis regulator FleN [Deltaproteobacteria bacterium]